MMMKFSIIIMQQKDFMLLLYLKENQKTPFTKIDLILFDKNSPAVQILNRNHLFIMTDTEPKLSFYFRYSYVFTVWLKDILTTLTSILQI